MKLRGSGFVVLGVWWLIALIVAGGLLVMAIGEVRVGGRIMAGAFVLAAFVRLVRTPRKAGGLTVRSRWIDVTALFLLAFGILLAVETAKLDRSPETVVRLTR